MLDADSAQLAHRIAVDVATAAAAVGPAPQRAYDVSPPRADIPSRDPSLAGGHAGIALLAAHLDACAPNEGWDRTGHRHLLAAVGSGDQLRYLGPGLHSGWGGLAFTAVALAGDSARYATFLEQTSKVLAAAAIRLADHVVGVPARLPAPTFDVISGLSGIAAVLITRRDDAALETALERVLHALVHAAGTTDGVLRVAGPVDWSQPANSTSAEPALNLGLAHGVPGVVAALALASQEGIDVDGSAEAIEALVETLRSYVYSDEVGPICPLSVPLDRPPAPPPGPVRTAWCHGMPGLARAMWLAGTALDRPTWRADALDAIKAAFRRPVEGRRLGSPTFCHGDAGLAQIGLRFAADTGDAELAALVRQDVARLVAQYDPDLPFGYRRIDDAGHERDSAALLDGAAGVALVLLAAAHDVEPRWDRAFMLS
ncbi:MAG TPA: lanthionine synthetase C family protein [Baekduia sp.]|nr:lanthionine synthetase C family protein [Baekduia sp.]